MQGSRSAARRRFPVNPILWRRLGSAHENREGPPQESTPRLACQPEPRRPGRWSRPTSGRAAPPALARGRRDQSKDAKMGCSGHGTLHHGHRSSNTSSAINQHPAVSEFSRAGARLRVQALVQKRQEGQHPRVEQVFLDRRPVGGGTAQTRFQHCCTAHPTLPRISVGRWSHCSGFCLSRPDFT